MSEYSKTYLIYSNIWNAHLQQLRSLELSRLGARSNISSTYKMMGVDCWAIGCVLNKSTNAVNRIIPSKCSWFRKKLWRSLQHYTTAWGTDAQGNTRTFFLWLPSLHPRSWRKRLILFGQKLGLESLSRWSCRDRFFAALGFFQTISFLPRSVLGANQETSVAR
jgi:hypothetical protein